MSSPSFHFLQLVVIGIVLLSVVTTAGALSRDHVVMQLSAFQSSFLGILLLLLPIRSLWTDADRVRG